MTLRTSAASIGVQPIPSSQTSARQCWALVTAVEARAEALVAEARRGDANAVEVARRKTRRAGEADKQAIDVGAFAAKLFRRQHRLDVAVAAAARRGDALRVRDEPIVDCARLVNIAGGAGHDFLSEVSLTIPLVGMRAVGLVNSARSSGARRAASPFPRGYRRRGRASPPANDLSSASARARTPGEVDKLGSIGGIAGDLGEIRVARPVRS